MCAIIGSFSKEKLEELHKLNSYRGESSYSFGAFDYIQPTMVQYVYKHAGKMPDDYIATTYQYNESTYYIAHTQAPTTDTDNIHPATYGNAMLWHNGIIKQKSMSPGTWDTAWLLEQILDYGWGSLSNVDGTFACIIYYSNDLYVFRNEISPIFYDSELNFSSTKFEGSISLPPNTVFKLDLRHKIIDPVAYFKTKENPYYIP
jgi:hypothetical protein